MKCQHCGYDDKGTGDTAHVCTRFQQPLMEFSKASLQQGLDAIWAERDALRRRVKELEAALVAVPHAQDAARYRFWRDTACYQPIRMAKLLARAIQPEQIDAGIDAAMKE